MKKSKKYGIVLGVSLFILLITSATYAYYYFNSSKDTNINLIVTKTLKNMIVYKQGNNILSTDGTALDLGDDYTSGISTVIEFWKKEGVTKDIYGRLNMKILDMLSKEGLDDANISKTYTVKWAITTYSINDDKEILLNEGNFFRKSKDDVFMLTTDSFLLNNYQTFYKVYLWLDRGEYDANQSVSGETISVLINASASDIKEEIGSKALDTLTSLGLKTRSDVPTFAETTPQIVFKDSVFSKTSSISGSSLNSDSINNYYTYADSYTFDESTGYYSLDKESVKVGMYKNIYDSLVGKYIVSYIGSTSPNIANYENLVTIYEITRAEYNSDDALSPMSYNVLGQKASQYDNSALGIYKDIDDLGDVYYFRGEVSNNYVYFGNFWWRIIRINGDGTIRIIYDGTKAHPNGEVNDDRKIATNSRYIKAHGDNAYVGYMYGEVGASSYDEAHENIHNSPIKEVVDKWYEDNIKDTLYEKYIEDEIYCNDRSLVSYNNKEKNGYGTIQSVYAFTDRMYSIPTFKCPQDNDKFTVSTDIGNGALTYPIGLITADEVIFAGANIMNEGKIGQNANRLYYLYTGFDYWTMTPHTFDYKKYNSAFSVHTNGYFRSNWGSEIKGIRPVISLKSDCLKYGTGEITNPFRVESEM